MSLVGKTERHHFFPLSGPDRISQAAAAWPRLQIRGSADSPIEGRSKLSWGWTV